MFKDSKSSDGERVPGFTFQLCGTTAGPARTRLGNSKVKKGVDGQHVCVK